MGTLGCCANYGVVESALGAGTRRSAIALSQESLDLLLAVASLVLSVSSGVNWNQVAYFTGPPGSPWL